MSHFRNPLNTILCSSHLHYFASCEKHRLAEAGGSRAEVTRKQFYMLELCWKACVGAMLFYVGAMLELCWETPVAWDSPTAFSIILPSYFRQCHYSVCPNCHYSVCLLVMHCRSARCPNTRYIQPNTRNMKKPWLAEACGSRAEVTRKQNNNDDHECYRVNETVHI